MNQNRYFIFIIPLSILVWICPVLDLLAQEVDKDSTRFMEINIEKLKFTPILAPSYAPETELMLNLGGLLTFKVKPMDRILQRSSIPFSVGYSTNKSLSANFRPFIYGSENRIRVYGDIWVKNMPDNYWGTGYQKGKRVSEPDSTTSYYRKWWQVNLNAVYGLGSRMFVGFNIDLNQTSPSEMNSFMMADPIVQEYGTKIRNSGIGTVVQYDTRDVAVNAYSGVYLSLTTSYYGKFFKGQNDYGIYQLDYRHFVPVKRNGRTLALQVKSRFGSGNVPWSEMSQLGTPFDLRGYRWGRYREKNMIFGLLEYRHMFMRKTPGKKGNLQSRSGFVTWIGTGSVAASLKDFKNWLPNGGVGYRFEIQSRMNARVDFGFGEDSNSFYVSFNEAF